MRKSILFLLAVSLIIMFTDSALAEWIKFRTHTHTKASDGQYTASRLMQKTSDDGFDGLLVTDHYEQILEHFTTFQTYLEQFVDPPMTTKGRPLLVIVGAEIAAFNGDGKVHILAFPVANWYPELVGNDQKTLLSKLQQMGLVTIVAHPFQPNYRVDTAHTDGLIGAELFNDVAGSGGMYLPTLDWINECCQKGVQLTLESGADLHGFANEKIEREQRATFVKVEEMSVSAVAKAFFEHQTYATNYGVYLENAEIANGDFSFDVCAGQTIAAPKTIIINRDGHDLPESIKTWLPGTKNFHYEWSDRNATGDHIYYVHVSGCLVTSPIKQNVLPKDPLEIYFDHLELREFSPQSNGGGLRSAPKEVFKNHVYIQIAIFFANKQPIPGKKKHFISYHLSIYGPSGKSVFETGGGSGSDNGAWTTETGFQYFSAKEKGVYQVVLKNKDQTKTIATKEFMVE